MQKHITRRGNATVVAGRVGIMDPIFILIDDKNTHLLEKLTVDWYTLIRETTLGRYFFTRSQRFGDKPLPLRTFNILEDIYHDTDLVTTHLPSCLAEDHHLWPGFAKTLAMIRRSNPKCGFKFNTEQSLPVIPECKTAMVFQKSDRLLFKGGSRLRVGMTRMRIGTMEYFSPGELFSSSKHLKGRL